MPAGHIGGGRYPLSLLGRGRTVITAYETPTNRLVEGPEQRKRASGVPLDQLNSSLDGLGRGRAENEGANRATLTVGATVVEGTVDGMADSPGNSVLPGFPGVV